MQWIYLENKKCVVTTLVRVNMHFSPNPGILLNVNKKVAGHLLSGCAISQLSGKIINLVPVHIFKQYQFVFQ